MTSDEVSRILDDNSICVVLDFSESTAICPGRCDKHRLKCMNYAAAREEAAIKCQMGLLEVPDMHGFGTPVQITQDDLGDVEDRWMLTHTDVVNVKLTRIGGTQYALVSMFGMCTFDALLVPERALERMYTNLKDAWKALQERCLSEIAECDAELSRAKNRLKIVETGGRPNFSTLFAGRRYADFCSEGPWYQFDDGGSTADGSMNYGDEFADIVWGPEGPGFGAVLDCSPHQQHPTEHSVADAKLAAEAGTVLHEVNRTPRELLNDIDRLQLAMRELIYASECLHDHDEDTPCLCTGCVVERAEQALESTNYMENIDEQGD